MPCGTFSSGVAEPPSFTPTYQKGYLGSCAHKPSETITSTPGLYGDFEHEVGGGQCTPGYHKLLREGALIPFTNWHKRVRGGKVRGAADYKWTDGSCTETYVSGDWRLTAPNWWISSNDLLDLVEDKESIRFVQEAAAKLQSTGHDMLTFLAELGKTRDSLRRVVKRIKSTKAWKLRGMRGVANAWLEWRYAWRPLIYDMEDIVEGLSNLRDKRNRLTEKAGVTTRWHDVVESVTGDEDPNANNIRTKQSTSYEVGVGGIVTGDLELKAFTFNPAVTAWELVPWSFVLDWIVNVQQLIEAMTFAMSTNYTAAKRHYVHIQRETHYSWEFVAPNWSGTASSMASSVGTLWWRIPCRVSMQPQFKNRINVDKARDLSLLMRGFFQ